MLVLIVIVAIVVFALSGAGAQGWGASSNDGDCGYEDFSGGERYDYDYDGYGSGDYSGYGDSRGLYERFQDGTSSKSDMELLMEDDDIREEFDEYGDF